MTVRRCGDYRVSIARRRVVVWCRACRVSTFSRTGARKLAEVLAGPLGRFETRAPREERQQLAQDLRRVARRLAP